MSSNNKLYRNFIILQEDERGFSSDGEKTLSGYSKIEAKGDKCKVSYYAQNLRSDDCKYYMVLICNKKDAKKIINLGELNVNSDGKGEATREYLSDSIGNLNISFDKVSGAAIMTSREGIPVYILCGFLNGDMPSDNWRNYQIVKAENFSESQGVNNKKSSKKDHKKNISKEEEPKTRENTVEENIIEEDILEELEEEILEEELETPIRSSKFDEYEQQIEKIKEELDEEYELRGSSGLFFNALVRGFEKPEGKIEDINNCKWHKVRIKDLYQMCNTSDYNKYTIVYYPMINYYPYIKKHGYFLLGLKGDKKGNVKYIVYAIPGDKEDQPYEGKTGFVTWAKDSKGNGYWLMFYDYKNATVVVPME